MNNRILLFGGLLSAGLLAFVLFFLTGGGPTVTVYKSPSCSCCTDWVQHLEENGFHVNVENMANIAIVKNKFGIAPKLQSCHTARVDGYLVEGHVPADLIHKLIREKPSIKGLAVPGMPAGSPGMEQPNGYKEPYNVLSFTADGKTRIYARR